MRQQIWGEVVDFNLAFFQSIWECNGENIIKIGPYLPKLLQEKFGAVFFGSRCIVDKSVYRLSIDHHNNSFRRDFADVGQIKQLQKCCICNAFLPCWIAWRCHWQTADNDWPCSAMVSFGVHAFRRVHSYTVFCSILGILLFSFSIVY